MTACGVHGNTLTGAENYGGVFHGAPRLIKVIVGSSIAIRTYTRHPLDLLAQKRRCFSSFISWRWAKIYAPNFAAYQGERVYLAGGTCTFQDGAVTGVGMYAYHKMGAGNGVWSRFSGVKPPLAVEAVNVSAASLFRKASDTAGLPTILYDEIDCVFGPKPKENEDLRGLLHAEHRRGAMAGRCMVRGRIVETEELPAFCAVALAGLGNLPDTILTRSVIIQMRRRAPHEHVEPFAAVSMLQKGNQLPKRPGRMGSHGSSGRQFNSKLMSPFPPLRVKAVLEPRRERQKDLKPLRFVHRQEW
jgi:hypothetical protein